MTSLRTWMPDSALPRQRQASAVHGAGSCGADCSCPAGSGVARTRPLISCAAICWSHKPVTRLAFGGKGFVDSVQVMSASDSPGLLAGNPPLAAGCPG